MLDKLLEADKLLERIEDKDESGWVTRARNYLFYAIEAAQQGTRQMDLQTKEKAMDELQFQTQMAKDTDEVAEYYRRLLQEARAERDEVIADARRLAKIAKNVHFVSESENNLIEKYAK